MNAFEIANLFIKNSNNEERIQKWISVKQTEWLLGAMGNEESFMFNRASAINEGKSKNNYTVENKDYLIKLYISPLNQAGTLTIEYKGLKRQFLITEHDQKNSELKAKIPQLEADIKEWESDPMPTNFSEFQKIKANELYEKMKSDLEYYKSL